MNTVQQTTTKVNEDISFVVAPQPTANDLYWQGFAAYCETNCLETALPTHAERRGWRAALAAQAQAEA